MDGYQVLEAILEQDLPTVTIVVSGDVQPEAYKRVIGLGALDFIQKPVNKEKLTQVLLSYGVFTKEEQSVAQAVITTNVDAHKSIEKSIVEAKTK